jgi:hypothetical protein
VPRGPYAPRVDFAFTQRAPSDRLARYVESIWHAHGQIPLAAIRRSDAGQLDAFGRSFADR